MTAKKTRLRMLHVSYQTKQGKVLKQSQPVTDIVSYKPPFNGGEIDANEVMDLFSKF